MITPYTCTGELATPALPVERTVKKPLKKPIVWAIGGSDSGAGAGIQADIQAINGLGAHACTLVTAVTAQSSVGVRSVNPVSVEVLADQLTALQEDMPPRVIKIGLLPSVPQVRYLADYIATLKQQANAPKVIFDPVAVASSGDRMADDGVLAAVCQYLLPLVDLLTPNLIEAFALADMPFENATSPERLVDKLLQTGVGSVLLKGGHALSETAAEAAPESTPESSQVTDLWSNGSEQRWLRSTRINTAHGHGTGCVLASAISAVWSLGYALEDALVFARAYLQQGLVNAYGVGLGAGPLLHGGWPTDPKCLPLVGGSEQELVVDDKEQAASFVPCPKQLGLYPVVDSVEWIERLLKAGVKTLQLRIKDPDHPELKAQVAKAVALGKQYQARLFINDYWQLAIDAGAYGVHLGQEDLLTADLDVIKSAGLRLGLSTHGIYELLRAAQIKPSYLALGHIYPTQTKQMPSKPQGVYRLAQQVALCPDVPLVAIGGISLERAEPVAATGVGSIAVVTAITRAEQPEQVIAQFNACLSRLDEVQP
ncbi:thiamine phosphate synthase [Corallincola platygyrae]|uniref:Thiamine-phosphate synthase n=1 Tax=Corallincola platygyrae TaxID=1193278 RepID=A0ABW4XQ71_9GAMM